MKMSSSMWANITKTTVCLWIKSSTTSLTILAASVSMSIGASGGYITGHGYFPQDLSKSLLDGNWHHLAIAYGSSRRRLYVDGSLISQSPNNAEIRDHVNDGMYLGVNAHYTYSSRYYLNGLIDNLRIYNYMLADEEVKAIYDAKQ